MLCPACAHTNQSCQRCVACACITREFTHLEGEGSTIGKQQAGKTAKIQRLVVIFYVVSIDAKGRHRAAGDERGLAVRRTKCPPLPRRRAPPSQKSFGTVTAARLGDWSPPSARPPMARRALPLAGSRWLPMPTEAPTSTMAAAEKRIQAATRYSAARGYATLAMQPLIKAIASCANTAMPQS